jgi:murein DD-endopeptidase MepM/ murein hydrolase activator NlpD
MADHLVLYDRSVFKRPGAKSALFCLVLFVLCFSTCSSDTKTKETCTGYPDWQSSPYVLPYPVGTSYSVAQGNCSGGGHSGAYKYSYDFDMPIGTTVTAARAGTVFQIRTGYLDGDTTPGHENYVKIQHADGNITAYSHLSTVLVQQGDVVEAGDVIGTSGNTGNTGGFRHLHFHLTPCSEPVDCGTLPITFRNTTANPQGLQVTHVYPALPY